MALVGYVEFSVAMVWQHSLTVDLSVSAKVPMANKAPSSRRATAGDTGWPAAALWAA
jgi:hypothetical protein